MRCLALLTIVSSVVLAQGQAAVPGDRCFGRDCQVRSIAPRCVAFGSFEACTTARFGRTRCDGDAGVLRVCQLDGGWEQLGGTASSSVSFSPSVDAVAVSCSRPNSISGYLQGDLETATTGSVAALAYDYRRARGKTRVFSETATTTTNWNNAGLKTSGWIGGFGRTPSDSGRRPAETVGVEAWWGPGPRTNMFGQGSRGAQNAVGFFTDTSLVGNGSDVQVVKKTHSAFVGCWDGGAELAWCTNDSSSEADCTYLAGSTCWDAGAYYRTRIWHSDPGDGGPQAWNYVVEDVERGLEWSGESTGRLPGAETPLYFHVSTMAFTSSIDGGTHGSSIYTGTVCKWGH